MSCDSMQHPAGDAVRIAVIGVGHMGSAHAKAIFEGSVEGLRLTALCDTSESRRAWCRDKFPGCEVFDDAHALFASRLADAVIIATPHRFHACLAQAAMECGLHVLSEKPADVSLVRTEPALKTQKETGLVYAVMLNQRTDPLFQKAREIVQSGELGTLKRSVWIITNWYRTQHYYDSGDWRATWAGEGGGVLLNQAPHNLDLWQWICGMPEEVTAFCDVARHHRIEVEDDATIFTRYKGGATGTFITSTGDCPGTNRLEITGDRGKMVLENGKLKLWRLEESEREVCFHSDISMPKVPFTIEEYQPEDKGKAHRGILENFGRAIRFGEPLLSPAGEAIRELAISNAAYLSAWEGNRPVSLSDTEAFTRFDRMLEEKASTSAYTRQEAAEPTFHPDAQYSNRWQVNW
ncbi:MAG: Gfo/Idh/MocA family oxidoreductase [Clostridia bacterium]|nr:Gfo/Idh/MocA family oxidoreductase [Clostridia bacterium]